jgi:hypothetical protein
MVSRYSHNKPAYPKVMSRRVFLNGSLTATAAAAVAGGS